MFSLDRVHSTTITYATLAWECIDIMQAAGVRFRQSDGSAWPQVKFGWVIYRNALISDPLKSLASDHTFLDWANECID